MIENSCCYDKRLLYQKNEEKERYPGHVLTPDPRQQTNEELSIGLLLNDQGFHTRAHIDGLQKIIAHQTVVISSNVDQELTDRNP